MCVSADNDSASGRDLIYVVVASLAAGVLTCVAKELAYSSWCAHSSTYFRPFQVCHMLLQLKMLCKELGNLPTFVTPQFLILEDTGYIYCSQSRSSHKYKCRCAYPEVSSEYMEYNAGQTIGLGFLRQPSAKCGKRWAA